MQNGCRDVESAFKVVGDRKGAFARRFRPRQELNRRCLFDTQPEFFGCVKISKIDTGSRARNAAPVQKATRREQLRYRLRNCLKIVEDRRRTRARIERKYETRSNHSPLFFPYFFEILGRRLQHRRHFYVPCWASQPIAVLLGRLLAR